MAREPRDIFGTVRRTLPSTSSDGGTQQLRVSNRGELIAGLVGKAGRVAAADEGSYFMATNPTPGTAIDGIAATGAFSDAESYFCLRNNNSVASGKRIILDRLRLYVEQAGTSGTDVRWVSKIDEGDRYTSGGSTLTPVNCNLNDGETTGAQLRAGALVTTAASAAARLIDHGVLRTVIAVVGDQYIFDFGGDLAAAPAALATAGTAQLQCVVAHAPVILTPGDSWVFSMHATSQAAASGFEFALGWYER